jgi:DNA invertase Pin-like site-specific DNA recombinase
MPEGIAYCYARVSTQMQVDDGMSLGAQERQMKSAAEGAGYEALILREEGKSGKSIQGRPVLRQALSDLDDGKAQALYVTRLDRLARSTRDFLSIVDRSNVNGWRLVMLDLGLDTTTANGRFVVTIMSAMAEMERGMISLRQKDIHSDRRTSGKVWGVDLGPKTGLPEEIRRMIYDHRNSGESFGALAKKLNEDEVPTTNGGKEWYASTVRHVYLAYTKELTVKGGYFDS